ncbi:MAG: ABC transporter ATP-binding protein [Clostridia bacterium]|nr:ABC transporter ATP-binding protein [Clostridia bacterium]MDD4387346.1 ABC transporter ATP-binding protein [Clostridia bacterium]
MSVIQIQNLTKDFGNNKGVFDISFDVKKGEIFGFLGPNGAGKTTAIRHILGFSKPQKGKTFVNNLNSWEHSHQIQKDLGYLPGEIAFPNDMTGIQFIHMMADMRDLKDMSKANALIEMLELDPSGDLKRMSKGMKQKIGIICAFMHDPKVLILDEPTSGLDPLMQRKFIELIKQEKKSGKTILMSSHMFQEIENTCDRIAIVKNGKIISIVSSKKIKNREQKQFEVGLTNKDDIEIISKEDLKFTEIDKEKSRLKIHFDDKDTNKFIKILSNYDITYFKEIKFTLEDYFMHFYGGEK